MADIPNKPETRKETYLAAIAGQNVDLPPYPITREEAYLDEIAKNGGGGGGYVLPTATASRLGGVKIGSGISVEEDGTISASGGGTSDYTDLTNKPSVNGVELSGNKTASQLGMANSNTFQGTIAEWNQLTTAEKKAYDHASIPDSIDGGDTFPANKVVMTGGGNVEAALDELTANGQGTRVDLTSYTQSNPYIAPSDGYFIIYLHPGSSGYGCIESTMCAIGGDYYDTDNTHNARYGIYVRKGMHIFCTGLPYYAAFIPIS